jgi:transcriptional regulator with XRE-family HTH domain
MPRPPGLPKFDSLGPRIRWWREHRKFKRLEFAKLIGMSYSGLADLENDRSQESKKLHLIAAKLRLNPYYLETDKGEPEAEFAQEPPTEPQDWPFPAVAQSKLSKLNNIERSYAETKLLEALAEIEAERRKAKKAG